MPCKKCKDGNYKYGNTGECKYATKESCEKANPKKYSKMRPTPLGKKSYEEYEKELKEYNLSKVERVELGAIDDLEKGIKKAITFSTKANDIMEKAAKSADTQADKFIKEARAMQKLKSDVEKQAKELGVDLPKNIKGLMDNLDANFESIIKLRKSILNLK